jgi:hypothetical protein
MWDVAVELADGCARHRSSSVAGTPPFAKRYEFAGGVNATGAGGISFCAIGDLFCREVLRLEVSSYFVLHG